MTPKTSHSLGKMPRLQSRGVGPTPIMTDDLNNLPYNRYARFAEDEITPTQAALQMSNDHIVRRMAKLQANTARLKRELFLLQRHVKEFQHPLFETWEADILTRLIEVAHAFQRHKMAGGITIGEDNTAERETLSHAYVNAAKQIHEGTLRKLGLSDQYYQALLRYNEIAAYRSPNPFQTEVPFAKWLVEEMENRPEKYSFWSKLYPVCYGRSVEESSTIF
ncbi:uncharacterized protein N7482_004089 [Penicillium canariense]|uniref:Uncharacterized protein n=1 Tax=Penicillium canariense TaxID=189055 RepID=A0A9W9I5Z1_9EURO|nr:uncharacterized protein N7482_004089 [Penicillium canariense]KAJ5168495.1 hypothetical protein N7482_004089 [Penicillium canariense]